MKPNTAKRLQALLRNLDEAIKLPESVRAYFRELPPETNDEVKAIAEERVRMVTVAELAKLTPPDPTAEQENDAIEAAYWDFDARKSGYAEFKGAKQSERDAFKSTVRALLVRGIK